MNVDTKVFIGLEAVRRSGITNMFDINTVQVAANRLGFFDAVIWLNDNSGQYAKGIMEGIDPVTPLTPAQELEIDRAAQALTATIEAERTQNGPILWKK